MARALPRTIRATSYPVDPGPLEMTTKVQSDVHGGSKAPWKGLKTQAWSERTPKYAFKSASLREKRALGAQLRPKPGMAASHPVDPGPLEMTTKVQSDVHGGSKAPLKGLKTRAWSARTPQYAFKSASPGEKRTLGAQLRPKPGMATSNPVDPGPLEIPTTGNQMSNGSKTPWGRPKSAGIGRKHPPVCFQVGFSR